MAPDELKTVVMLFYNKRHNAILHIPTYMIP